MSAEHQTFEIIGCVLLGGYSLAHRQNKVC